MDTVTVGFQTADGPVNRIEISASALADHVAKGFVPCKTNPDTGAVEQDDWPAGFSPPGHKTTKPSRPEPNGTTTDDGEA